MVSPRYRHYKVTNRSPSEVVQPSFLNIFHQIPYPLLVKPPNRHISKNHQPLSTPTISNTHSSPENVTLTERIPAHQPPPKPQKSPAAAAAAVATNSLRAVQRAPYGNPKCAHFLPRCLRQTSEEKAALDRKRESFAGRKLAYTQTTRCCGPVMRQRVPFGRAARRISETHRNRSRRRKNSKMRLPASRRAPVKNCFPRISRIAQVVRETPRPQGEAAGGGGSSGTLY